MKPGIYKLAADEYHADPCSEPSLSSSIAKLLCERTPLHAWNAHPRLNPNWQSEEKGIWDIGTAAHALLLESREPQEVIEIIDAENWRTKAAREARDEAREAGKVPLLAHVVADVIAMVDAAGEQFLRMDADPMIFGQGKPEQTLVWEEDGIFCRALADWLHDDYRAIDDYKTTSASANPDTWTRTLFGIGADIQTAFYLHGLRALTGVDAELRYIVQETYPPYALSVVSLGPDVLAVAEAKVEYAIRTWRDCLQSGLWPGYPSRVCYAELPAWEEARWMEKEVRET